MIEAGGPFPRRFLAAPDEQTLGTGILELHEAKGAPRGIPHHEVTSEVAEQGIFEGDPVQAIHVRAGGGDERREMPAVMEEVPDGFLAERGMGVEPIAQLTELLTALGAIEIQRLENLHRFGSASTPPETLRRSRDGRDLVRWHTVPIPALGEEFQEFTADEVE